MQKTVCTRDRSLCLLPFDMCEITKVPQIPTECLSILAKMAKTKERKQKEKKEFTSSYGAVTQEDVADEEKIKIKQTTE